MRTTTIVVLAAALAIPAGGARATEPEAAPATAFELTDRNHDGSVDRAEFMLRETEVFYFADANKNGFLEIEEVTDVEPARFKAADRDGTGRLSIPEFLDARSTDYDTADKNDNGMLTPGEAAAK